MTLPLLISVPHGGLQVPPEIGDRCLLTKEEIVADGDEGAAELYAISDRVACFVTTDIARAIVDQNRAEGDRRKDGVVKTHTCWDVPIYREPLDEPLVQDLLEKYHRPYHAAVREKTASGVWFGLDCHTMAAAGPPVGPDPGRERPWICVSDAGGTAPAGLRDSLIECLKAEFEGPVLLNDPFGGGFIIREHSGALPWLQLEFSRAPFLALEEKRRRLLVALERWCELAPAAG